MTAEPFACRRCVARGKTWTGADPQCGFRPNGRFISDNWNCATLNALRELGEKQELYGNEDNAAIFPRPDGEAGFVVLCWYKSRGRTEQAFLLTSDGRSPLTLRMAEMLLGDSPKRTLSAGIEAARAEQKPGRCAYCEHSLPPGHRLVCARSECRTAYAIDYQRDYARRRRTSAEVKP